MPFETQHYKVPDNMHRAISYTNDLMQQGIELGIAALRASNLFKVDHLEIKSHLYADLPDTLLDESIGLTIAYYRTLNYSYT